MTRGRAPTKEEEALFHSVLKDVKPLRIRPVRIAQPIPKPKILHYYPPVLDAPVSVGNPAPNIGGHDDRNLGRGRIETEARLDLHGMTQENAYRATIRFLSHAQFSGYRVVLVITGKGGVLRSLLPVWLGQPELRPLVAGLREAHVRHGGAGAFYVLLRRKQGR